MQILFLATLLTLNAIYFHTNAFRLFVFWDMGAFLGASWRVVCGQAPYRDFLLAVSPVHVYLNAFFIKFLGFTKLAMWAHLVVLSSILALFTFWALRSKLSFKVTAILTILSLVSFNWQVCHPWYTQTAYFWGLLATFYLLKKIPFASPRSALICGFMMGFMAMLSFMTKINVGAAFGLIFLLFILAAPHPGRSFLGFVAGLVLSLALVKFFFIHDWNTFVSDVFLQFPKSQSSRIQYLFIPAAIFNNFYWLTYLMVVLAAPRVNRKTFPRWILFTGLWAVAHFSTFTSSNNLHAEFPLMGAYLAAGWFLMRPETDEPTIAVTGFRRVLTYYRRSVHDFYLGLAVFLIALCLYQGVRLSAWWYSPETQDYPLEMKGFEGWKCNRTQGFPLNMFAHSLPELPKEDSILMLNDMQMLYGLTGRTPYPGVPDGWASRQSPLPGPQWEKVRNNILNNPPTWIITHKRYAAKWIIDIVNYLELEEFLKTRYLVAVEYGAYIVLRRKI